MDLETCTYAEGAWSLPALPDLDSPRTLVLVFGASGLLDRPAPLLELGGTYPTSHLLGCSTAGEISGAGVSDDSLSVAVVRFHRTDLRSAFAPTGTSDGSFAAGRAIASQLQGPALRGVILLSDGLTVNGSELIAGINDVLPNTVVVTGGLAGDGDRFQRTWVMQGGRPAQGGVSAVGLYGDSLIIGHGSQGGWDFFGPERRVTRSSGNVLYEIDGRPALSLYRRYLGERASGLPATALLFPLGLRAQHGDDKTLVRTVLAIDEENQSMTFAGDIPEGSIVQLMRSNIDRLIGGASEAGRRLHASSDAPGARLGIAISCVGRRLVLGERAEEEIEAVLNALPAATQLVGFYSYGEIAPGADGRCDLHNQTMTLTMLAER